MSHPLFHAAHVRPSHLRRSRSLQRPALAVTAVLGLVASLLVAVVLQALPADAASPTGPAVGSNCAASGNRSGAQMDTHNITDLASVAFNPTNGNMAMQGTLLRMAGVGVPVSINWRYNAINDGRPTLNVGMTEAALVPDGSGGFKYTQNDGGCYDFTKSGSVWLTPAGINATLTQSGSNMDLRMNPGGVHNIYTLVGSTWELTKQNDTNDKTGATPNTVTYTYGATGGLLSQITDTQGRTITFAYTDPHNATQPSSIVDTSLSRTIGLTYGGTNGALSAITDPAGDNLTFGYDATGLISITDANSHQTTFSYDGSSRASTWTYGFGSSNAAAFSVNYFSSTETRITDPNTNVTKIDYDSSSRVTSTTDANGNPISNTWDSHDNIKQQTDAISASTTFDYGNATNPNNMLAKITSPASGGVGSPTGAVVSSTYPTTVTGTLRDYQPSTQVDGQGDTTTYTYDQYLYKQTSSSQTDSHSNPVGGTTHDTYQGDHAGTTCSAKSAELCSSTNANGGVTSYGYDANGNVTTITPPSPLGARTLTYDAAGRLKTETDGRGNTQYLTYDNDDRVTQDSYSSGTGCGSNCVSFQYDPVGNMDIRQSPGGAGNATLGYDALNRLDSVLIGGHTVSATYDGVSNMLTYSDGPSGTTTYAYDAGNRLHSIAEPGGSCPTGTIAHPNATKCTSIDYQSSGGHTTTRRAHVYYPNGQVTATTYDGAGRTLTIAATNGASTTFAGRTYTYQTSGAGGTGADQGLRATQLDQVTSLTTTYAYDGFERLQSATPSTGSAQSWTYDNDGNRATAVTGATTTYTGNNTADELCFTATVSGGTCAAPPGGATTFTSDTTGNQTTDTTGTNGFNVFNQVATQVHSGTTTTNTYDDSTNSVRTKISTSITNNVSLTTGILGVTNTMTFSGTATKFIRDPSGTLLAMQSGGNSYYYTEDALGSVIALSTSTNTLAASYTYGPWGNLTSTPPTGVPAQNPFTYVAGYNDGTSLIQFQNRYYNPATGRFNQPDPSHQENNLYAYAKDDPIDNSDANGLDSEADILGGLGGFAAGFLGYEACGGICAGAAAGFVGTFYGLGFTQEDAGEPVDWKGNVKSAAIAGFFGGLLGLFS